MSLHFVRYKGILLLKTDLMDVEIKKNILAFLEIERFESPVIGQLPWDILHSALAWTGKQ